jgi:hypothetical protein
MGETIGHSHIGEKIETVDLVSEERDGSNRLIAAGLFLSARRGEDSSDFCRFSLEVMTKNFYADNAIKRTFDAIDAPEQGLADTATTTEERPPFVVNDQEINEDIIKRKFLGRVIEPDLANSLWELAPDDPNL